MSLEIDWFGKWKEKNYSMKYRLGFTNQFLIDYCKKEELVHLGKIVQHIHVALERSERYAWKEHWQLSNTFRDYRLILRARHSLSFNSEHIYQCYGKCYAELKPNIFGTAGYVKDLRKGDILVWVSRDEANRNIFMHKNKLIMITGTSLDKIRRVKEEKK